MERLLWQSVQVEYLLLVAQVSFSSNSRIPLQQLKYQFPTPESSPPKTSSILLHNITRLYLLPTQTRPSRRLNTPRDLPSIHRTQQLQALRAHIRPRKHMSLPAQALRQEPDDHNEDRRPSHDNGDVVHRGCGDRQEDGEAEQHGVQANPEGGEDVAEGAEDGAEVEVAAGKDLFAASEEGDGLWNHVGDVQ